MTLFRYLRNRYASIMLVRHLGKRPSTVPGGSKIGLAGCGMRDGA